MEKRKAVGLTGTNLTNSSRKHKRSAVDLYSTPPDVTKALISFLDLPSCAKVWECACGEGMMARTISSYGYTVFSTDLHDHGYGVGETDFLIQDQSYGCEWIVTNPPFSLSMQFIEKALWMMEFRDIDGFAFLLKSQYWHAKKRLSLFYQRPPAYVLPLTWRPDFMFGERGGAPTMDVLWTVWMRCNRHAITEYKPLGRPERGTEVL